MATTKYYVVKPVSTLTFAVVETDSTGVVLKEAQPQNLDQLNYTGLFKFLFLIHKMDAEKLGVVSSQRSKLPSIDLKKGLVIPPEFEKTYPLNQFRAQLKQFLDQWFVLSLESQQKTAVNPSVGTVQWENKNTIKPSVPSYIQHGSDGAKIVQQKESFDERKTIAELIQDLQALNAEVLQCKAGTTTACDQAVNTAAKIQANIQKIAS